MEISDYLAEIAHAAETVISEIYRERDGLAETQAELDRLTAATHDGYQRVEFLAMNPDLDDEGLGTAIDWDTYFGVDKERHSKSAEQEKLLQRLGARQFSTAALSASLLQYGALCRFVWNATISFRRSQGKRMNWQVLELGH
ncbi:MAG: hypothetical protein H7255_05190 [Ramlibacter sp.]|nr:hypothetical protein [Ramlibacter sp.]